MKNHCSSERSQY